MTGAEGRRRGRIVRWVRKSILNKIRDDRKLKNMRGRERGGTRTFRTSRVLLSQKKKGNRHRYPVDGGKKKKSPGTIFTTGLK